MVRAPFLLKGRGDGFVRVLVGEKRENNKNIKELAFSGVAVVVIDVLKRRTSLWALQVSQSQWSKE